MPKINKTCADCKFHICTNICTERGFTFCDGKCAITKKHRKCSLKACEKFKPDINFSLQSIDIF